MAAPGQETHRGSRYISGDTGSESTVGLKRFPDDNSMSCEYKAEQKKANKAVSSLVDIFIGMSFGSN
jgi:hypothetical protein